MKQIPIYVIGLPWACQRKKRMTAQLDKNAISYEMVDAVDGNFLSAYERLRHKMHLTSKFKSRLLTNGEQGAVLSHHKVYEMILKRKDEHAVILEDDAIINEDLKSLLDNINRMSSLAGDWNICYLGYFYDTLGSPLFKSLHYPIELWRSKKLKFIAQTNKGSSKNKSSSSKYKSTNSPSRSNSYRVGKFIVRPRGAFGYMLTQKAARLLLHEHSQRNAALIADRALSNAVIPGLVGIAPALIHHDNEEVEECITQRPPSNFKHRTLNRDMNRLANLMISITPFLKNSIYGVRYLIRRLRATSLFIASRQYNRFRTDYEM